MHRVVRHLAGTHREHGEKCEEAERGSDRAHGPMALRLRLTQSLARSVHVGRTPRHADRFHREAVNPDGASQ